MLRGKFLLTLTLFCVATAVLAESGIYICGHFRRDREKAVTEVKNSGFTFGILFNVHVEADGTLTTDGEVICKDGEYVFDKIVAGYANDKAQTNYVDDLNSLLSGKTSLQRLEHCIGGWNNHAYLNISNLVNAQGTGESSILYRNFKALKDAIPAVIAVNNDIEHDYEANSQSKFHIMLYDIGFKTTIAPYTNKSYWESFVAKVEAARPGAIDRNYLQCYGGGSGNNPANWKIAGLPIYGSRDIEANPGLTHQEIVTAMTNWKNAAGIVGGFYWNYNYNRNLKAFAAPINAVFGGGEVVDRSRIVAMVYPEEAYRAPQINLTMGDYTRERILSMGFDANQLKSVRLEEGVKMVLFTEDDFKGDSVVVDSNTGALASLTGDRNVCSWRVLANSIDEITGNEFLIKNKQSGYVIKPFRNGQAPTLYQMASDDTDYSVWRFERVENDLYRIVNKGSGLVLQTDDTEQASYSHDALSVTQAEYVGGSNQHFIVRRSAGDAYKLVPLRSLKYIGIADNKQMEDRTAPVQRVSSSAPSVDWLLIAAEGMPGSVSLPEAGLFRVYPSLTKGEISIDGLHAHASLRILGADGRLVLEKRQVSERLDISTLPAGVYLLCFQSEKRSETVRIIKI